MKKYFPLAFVLALTGCSAAQKQAAIELGLDEATCIVTHLDEDFEHALLDCGMSTLTDPARRSNLEKLWASSRAGARKAGATVSE